MLNKIVYICLLLLVFSIPFEIDFRRFNLDLPWINTSLEILMTITFLFWLAKKIRERKFVRSPFDIPILLYLVFNLISTFFAAADPYWSLKFIFRLTGGVFLYYLVLDTVKSREHVRDIVWMLLLSSVIVSIVGLGEKFFLERMQGILKIFSSERSYLHGGIGLLRVSSTFIYTNILAMYLEMVIPVIAGLFLFEFSTFNYSRQWARRFFFFVVLLLVQVLIFTYSRASLIVIYGTFGFLFLVFYGIGKYKILSYTSPPVLLRITKQGGKKSHRRRRFSCKVKNLRIPGHKGVLVLAVAVGILYGITTYLDFTMQRRLSKLIDFKYHPNAQRLYVWSCALKIIREHPLLGIGPDNFRWIYTYRYARASPYLKFNPITPIPGVDSNNVYLETLASLGIAGAVVYFWLMIKHFLYFIKNLLLYEAPRAKPVVPLKKLYLLCLSIGFGGAFAAYFIHGFVDSFGCFQPLIFLFWLILGVIVVLPRIET